MHQQESTIDPKKLARSLQAALKDLGVSIQLGKAQEAVAKVTGNGNWRTIAALRKRALGTAAAPADAARKPRVLITVREGVADYVCDEGVEVVVFDHDCFEMDPEDTPVAPAHFADLAEPINAAYDHGVRAVDETTPQAIRDAFEHVRSVFPDVVQVRYGADYRWCYTDAQGHAKTFDARIDVGLLEEAADAVDVAPVTYRLPSTSPGRRHRTAADAIQAELSMYGYRMDVDPGAIAGEGHLLLRAGDLVDLATDTDVPERVLHLARQWSDLIDAVSGAF